MNMICICLIVFGSVLPSLAMKSIVVPPRGSKKYWNDEPYVPDKLKEDVIPKFQHDWFPFLVAIQRWLTAPTERWFDSCSGSIVSTNVVLTSCQCVGKEMIRDKMSYFFENWVRAVAGSPDSRNLQAVNVKSFKAHPQCKYPDQSLTADLGLVFLVRAFEFGRAIQPMKFFSHSVLEALAEFQILVEKKRLCYARGWRSDTTDINGSATTLSIVPSITVFKLLSENRCNEKFCSLNSDKCLHNFSSNHQFCVMGSVHSPSCFSDIGGPLVCDEYVFGVASWTTDHCITSSPSIFTDISAIQTFLNLEGEEYSSFSQRENEDAMRGLGYSNSAPFFLAYYTTVAGLLLMKIS